MTPEPVRIAEIVPLERYRHVRDAYRRAVIEHKRQRRLPVGDRVTLVFEDGTRKEIQAPVRKIQTQMHKHHMH